MDDLCVREDGLDKADVQEIVGPLVGNQPVLSCLYGQSLQVEGSPPSDRLRIGCGHRDGIVRNPIDQRWYKVEFSSAGHATMPGENLLGQRRTRSKQAADGDGSNFAGTGRMYGPIECRDQPIGDQLVRSPD